MTDTANVDSGDDDAAIEAKAREQGWTPEDEYTGKGPWKNPREFVEFGERLNPILKKQRDEIKAENARLAAQLSHMNDTVSDLVKSRTERLKQEYENQVAYLKSQIRVAKREGDVDTVDQLEEALEAVKAAPPPEPAKAAPAQNQLTPEFLSWAEANKDWYEKDEAMTEYVLGAAQKIRNADSKIVGKEFFDKIDARLRATFPEKFKKASSSMVDSTNSSGGTKPRAKSFEAIPAEHRATWSRYHQDFPKKTKEDFAADYWS